MAKEKTDTLGNPPPPITAAELRAGLTTPPANLTLPAQIGFRPDQLTEMVERGQISAAERGAIERVQMAVRDSDLPAESKGHARYLYAGWLQRRGRLPGESMDAAAFITDFKQHIAIPKGGN